MPAYRSPDEGEIRDEVVARLRAERPASRIIHEINVSNHGPNRVDVAAVGVSEIITVEIKSRKDKLDRLQSQVAGMRGMAHTVIVAVHEKFLVEKLTNVLARHSDRDGAYYRRDLPDDFPGGDEAWIHPRRRRCVDPNFHDSHEKWRLPEPKLHAPLPETALNMLWNEELILLCNALGHPLGRRPVIGDMRRALRWNFSGRDLTLGVCAVLRARKCAEADPPIPFTFSR